ncbi:MAG TPA: hypothetical protein VM076_06825 [Gemmatimonadaceae bacterium]|nr:hypothetical protein [Gemmatimonadaceae bacterium]
MVRRLMMCALIATTACARQSGGRHPTNDTRTAQMQSRSVDPTGQYDLRFTDDGANRPARMVVEGVPGAYTGRINAENRPETRITAVAASGPQVIVTADIPQGVLLIRLRMQGDSVRGDWSLRNDGGRVVGVHRPNAK